MARAHDTCAGQLFRASVHGKLPLYVAAGSGQSKRAGHVSAASIAFQRKCPIRTSPARCFIPMSAGCVCVTWLFGKSMLLTRLLLLQPKATDIKMPYLPDILALQNAQRRGGFKPKCRSQLDPMVRHERQHAQCISRVWLPMFLTHQSFKNLSLASWTTPGANYYRA